ncbi:MAG: tRNA (guanosine(46)-N7)-methyltransferase TrmB [Bacilli bacterium]
MRLRNLKNREEIIANCNYFYSEENNFSNNNPINIEIGMGKGKFILEMALKHPNINFIGVEKFSNVAAVAIKKIGENVPTNLRIIVSDALFLNELLERKVSVIYLNFSDPWPKARHYKRRLTSSDYLSVYSKLFKDKNIIIQKTDNDALFSFSKESLTEYGYKITEISYDLHKENIDNVLTEYEEKFSKSGIKIKYLKAEKE